MKCPKCDFDNPSDTRFCGNCGSYLHPSEKVSSPPAETLQMPIKELNTGSIFARRYEVIEELGKGGMGRVYKVFDKKIKEKIALKLLKPEIASDEETVERFSNELKYARKIIHKNVCRMFDLSEEEGTHYITMEYVSGEDLKSMIRMMGRLSPGQTVSMAKQVCEGLAEAHKLGVVHRDLKPQNIIIDRAGNARIMDFGIARSLKAKGITDAGTIIGTPEYMSPEQVEGKEVDQRSDIYALGVIFYEMLTGRVPFEGDTPLSIAVKHKTEAPQDPRKLNAQVPLDLSQLILKCLEKDKKKRPQSAEEVLSDLNKIEKEIPATEKILPQRKPLTSREFTATFHKRWKIIAALFFAAVVVVIGFFYFRKEKPAPPPEKKRLVVLPFENLGSPEDEYFADGITDEITARIASISQLEVIARTSAIQYKKTDKNAQKIGEELGVNYILTGTIRWQRQPGGPNKVRVTPALVKASDARQIWANVYDETIAEVFQVQSEIAKQVAEALNIALLEPERRFIETKPTENLEAYNYYLRGNEYYNRSYVEADLRIAVEMYEKAIKLDPKFALSHAQLAEAHSFIYWLYYDHTEERLAKAKEAADNALKLKPDLPEAHLALGNYYYRGHLDYEHALEQFAIAQKSKPNNSDLFFAIASVQRRQGKLREAAMNFKKGLELDPRSNRKAFNIAETYYLMRLFPEMERYLDEAISIAPDWTVPHVYKALLFLNREGNPEKARGAIKMAPKEGGEKGYVFPVWVLIDLIEGKYQEALNRISSEPSEAYETQFYFIPKAQLYAQIYGLMNEKQKEQEYYNSARTYLEIEIKEQSEDSRFYSAIGIAYAGLGFKQKAIQEAEKAVELLPISKEAYKGTYRVLDLARVYTMVGEYDKAIAQLEFLLSIPSSLSVPLLRLDPVWTPLHSHPRFQKLLKK